MGDKQLPNAGIGTGATLTTTLIGIGTSLSPLIPQHYQEAYVKIVPYLCPLLSWVLVRAYNHFLEPEELAAARRKLERDLKIAKKAMKDKELTEEERLPFREEYIATRRAMTRLGRNFNDKALQLEEAAPQNTETT
ncbi:hypothetical protein [Citrobacter werkmanii]|uniref:hypothetical protein n=1 Tax=Citrobacter werkmanii TaxID=67827 RepID=UPI00300D23DA